MRDLDDDTLTKIPVSDYITNSEYFIHAAALGILPIQKRGALA